MGDEINQELERRGKIFLPLLGVNFNDVFKANAVLDHVC